MSTRYSHVIAKPTTLPPLIVFALALAVAIQVEAGPQDAAIYWARVDVSDSLTTMPFPVHAHLRDAAGIEYILTRSTRAELDRSGYSFETIREVIPLETLYLAQPRRPVNRESIQASVQLLYDDGHNLLILPGTSADRSILTRLGFAIRRLPDTPMILPDPLALATLPLSPSISSNAYVASMIANVHMTNLYIKISELTGATPVMAGGVFTNIFTRNTYETAELDRALDYAHSRLEAIGLDVAYHQWSGYDKWAERDIDGRNLIAERTGATTPSEIVILCAHIDSLPDGLLAPGADDNASGTVAVLTAARVMQHYTFDRTIRYVLFTGEEQGLHGSKAYAASIQDDNVVGVFNLDMLAYDSTGDGALNLLTRLPTDPGYAGDIILASIFTNVASMYTLETHLAPNIISESLGVSDHAAFWRNGFPAIGAEEHWEEDFNPHYHTINDTIEHLNFPYYTAFAQAAIGAFAHAAGPHESIPPTTLTEGVTTNLSLVASQTNTYHFTTESGVYYGVQISGATADIRLALTHAYAPATVPALSFTNGLGWTSPASGTYRLELTTDSNTSANIRLYTLTNTIAQATAIITNHLAERDVSAFSVALVDGEHIVWQDGFGLADRENNIPATAQTIYNVGSVSKTFTAVAVMQWVDRGELLLDEPLTNHFPGLVLQPRFPDAPPMTARQLLAHLSGLPAEFENGMITLWPVASSDVTRVMAALPGEYPAMPPNFTPVYCNTGWTVAEALVEKLSGMSFTEYTREHIFQPLGMTNTAMQHDAFAMETPPARPYRDGKRLPFEYLAALGAGAATSTSADLARFLTMLLGAGTPHPTAHRVLQPESVREMFRPQATNTTLHLTGNSQYPFFSPGLGFDGTHSDPFAYLDELTPNELGRFACKGGDTLTQHAFITLLPDAQLAIALNISGQGVPLFVAADRILRYATLDKFGEYGPDELPEPPPSDIVPATADDLRALEGTYSTGDGYTLIAADTNNLTLTWIADAHTPEPHIHTGLVLRANGWFSSPASQDVELLFTNVLDQACIVMRTTILVYRQEKLYAQRYTPAPLSTAWSNRVGDYVSANLAPGEYEANALDEQLSFKLAITNGLLALVNKEKGTLLYNPINEHTALLNFYGERSITSLRFDPEDDRFIYHADFLLQRLDSIPLLSAPGGTNGIITADETILYRIPVTAGQAYTLDLTTTNTVQATLSHGDDIIGRANTAYAFHIVPETDADYVLAINRDGPYPGPWSLAIHTNAIPFYHHVQPTDWPAELAARTNLFPNTDFGYVFVKEKRESGADFQPASFPVLKLAVARMNSSDAHAQPLFFSNGGPEYSSILCVYQHYLSAFTDTYDVYLIDQRGINFSQPLLAARENETLAQTQYRLTVLDRADLSTINTTESSYDLEDLATAFALSDVNVLGQSYGTLLAQALMRREPGWLRAVVLDGPVAPNIAAFEEGGLVMREAFDALVRDVTASPTAATWYPELNEEFYSLAARLQEHPYTLILPGWTNVIDGMTFIEAVTSQLTMSDLGTREHLPNVIWRAWRGEQAALAELYTGSHFDPATMIPNVNSDLMGRLVIRHDFLPFTTLEGVTNAAAGLREPLRTYAIAYDTAIINSAAELDDYGQAPPEFALPVTNAIPTLVINGTYDTQTGTNWAVEVASHLPNSHLVLLPTVGHGVLAGGECPQQIIRDFLADPHTPPNTSCIDDLALDFPPPWPDSIPEVHLNQAVTSHFPSAQSGIWYQFAAHSNIIYDITAGPTALHIVDDQAQMLHTATGSTSWLSSQQGPVSFWLVSDQPATHTLLLDLPLLMRGITPAPHADTLVWQSPEDATSFTIEAATDLRDEPAFIPVATNLTVFGVLHQHTITNAPASHTNRFYRFKQE